jgi:hypothetical protein
MTSSINENNAQVSVVFLFPSGTIIYFKNVLTQTQETNKMKNEIDNHFQLKK